MARNSDHENLLSLLEKVEGITDPVCVTERNDRIVAVVDEALRIRRQLNRRRKAKSPSGLSGLPDAVDVQKEINQERKP